MEELETTLQATIETPYPSSCPCLHDWRGTSGKAADGIREAFNYRWASRLQHILMLLHHLSDLFPVGSTQVVMRVLYN
jgi:hypothetical protein